MCCGHLWQTEQWCALSGLMLQHLGHLKITWELKTLENQFTFYRELTCPSSNPILWMFSLVAFPFGTAPVTEWHAYKIFFGESNLLIPGSVSIVRRWELTARKARPFKRAHLEQSRHKLMWHSNPPLPPIVCQYCSSHLEYQPVDYAEHFVGVGVQDHAEDNEPVEK